MERQKLRTRKTINQRNKKSIRQDRRERILEMTSKDLDVRDRWLGTRKLRTGYQPLPYNMKDSTGKRIPMGNKTEAAADFLATQIWGNEGEQNETAPHDTPTSIRTNK